jgi:hypothetical protein
MNILSFKNSNFTEIKEKDENQRNIGYSILKNVLITGRNHYYPNVLLYSDNNNLKLLYSPYDEKVMSLNKDSFYDNNIYEDSKSIIKYDDSNIIITDEVFFFIYNFDNYYHFIYDTIPYLYTYLVLKDSKPSIKLLINYPNKDTNSLYKFNEEFLYKIVSKDDIIIHSPNNVYELIYVSTSLTHGGLSNSPPRKEIFEIYDIIKSNINYDNINDIYKNPKFKRFYISRRTWLNEDRSNIGTDYTSRRKMINENNLVNELDKKGFIEIFTENLNTDEKLYLFSNADEIVGSIGGGMANLLFSKPSTKSYIIVSPFFLDINYRFKYSMENTIFHYFYDTSVYIEDIKQKIPLYCRVQIINKNSIYYNKIGEIVSYFNGKYEIALSNNDVAGFNNNYKFLNISFSENEFKLLDNGLNSPYIFDYNKIMILLKI